MDQNVDGTQTSHPTLLCVRTAALAPSGDELQPKSLYPLNSATEDHLSTYSAFYEQISEGSDGSTS